MAFLAGKKRKWDEAQPNSNEQSAEPSVPPAKRRRTDADTKTSEDATDEALQFLATIELKSSDEAIAVDAGGGESKAYPPKKARRKFTVTAPQLKVAVVPRDFTDELNWLSSMCGYIYARSTRELSEDQMLKLGNFLKEMQNEFSRYGHINFQHTCNIFNFFKLLRHCDNSRKNVFLIEADLLKFLINELNQKKYRGTPLIFVKTIPYILAHIVTVVGKISADYVLNLFINKLNALISTSSEEISGDADVVSAISKCICEMLKNENLQEMIQSEVLNSLIEKFVQVLNESGGRRKEFFYSAKNLTLMLSHLLKKNLINGKVEIRWVEQYIAKVFDRTYVNSDFVTNLIWLLKNLSENDSIDGGISSEFLNKLTFQFYQLNLGNDARSILNLFSMLKILAERNHIFVEQNPLVHVVVSKNEKLLYEDPNEAVKYTKQLVDIFESCSHVLDAGSINWFVKHVVINGVDQTLLPRLLNTSIDCYQRRNDDHIEKSIKLCMEAISSFFLLLYKDEVDLGAVDESTKQILIGINGSMKKLLGCAERLWPNATAQYRYVIRFIETLCEQMLTIIEFQRQEIFILLEPLKRSCKFYVESLQNYYSDESFSLDANAYAKNVCDTIFYLGDVFKRSKGNKQHPAKTAALDYMLKIARKVPSLDAANSAAICRGLVHLNLSFAKADDQQLSSEFLSKLICVTPTCDSNGLHSCVGTIIASLGELAARNLIASAIEVSSLIKLVSLIPDDSFKKYKYTYLIMEGLKKLFDSELIRGCLTGAFIQRLQDKNNTLIEQGGLNGEDQEKQKEKWCQSKTNEIIDKLREKGKIVSEPDQKREPTGQEPAASSFFNQPQLIQQPPRDPRPQPGFRR
jgi:hypothetical protein